MQALYICLFNPFPSFSSPSLLFHFLALVSFLARSKPKISFLGLSSLRTKGKRKRLLRRPLFSFLLRLSYTTHFLGFLSPYHDLSIVPSSGMRGEEIIKSHSAKELSFFSLLSFPPPYLPKTK